MNLPLLSAPPRWGWRPLGLLLALLATAGTAQAQTPAATFAAAATYSTGTNSAPPSIAVADVNGDGRPDLLTANDGSNTAGVLLGNGNGTFQMATTYGTGNLPQGIAVADVNGDGRPDLLTVNGGGNGASVLLGNGNGTFQPAATTYGTSNAAVGIAVADVNGDGRPDLLTANGSDDSAGVLLGNGNGTFQPAATFSTGTDSTPIGIAVADVNGDGRPDLLTANGGSNTAGVLLGNGDGTFQTATTYRTGGGSPVSIAVADVNGDGRPDLLTANLGGSTAGVLLGNGNGTFQTAATYPTTTSRGNFSRSIAVADVNSDGRLDLLTANSYDNSAGVLLGNGNGTFQPVTTYGTGAGSTPYGIAVADVNGDGQPDLLTANFGSSTAGVLLNATGYAAPTLTSVSPTSGTVGQRITLSGTSLSRATAVSFNGTAATTFTVVNATTLTATVPNGTTTGPVTVTTPGGTSNGVAFTVVTPLVVTSTSPARNTNTAPRPTNVALTYSQPVTAANAPVVRVFSPQAGGLKAGTTTVSGSTVTVDPATDFKPGETVFVTSVSSATAAPYVYQFTTKAGVGPGTFSPGSEVGVDEIPDGVALGDVDGDGDLDLLTANYGSGTVSVRLNGGNNQGTNTGTFSGGSNVTVGKYPTSVALGDVDGDGDLDLLTTNLGSNSVSVRLNGGINTGTFSGGADVSVGNNPYSVALGDVDGDGDLDLLAANYGSNSVSVRLNGGNNQGTNTGTFSNGSEVGVGGSPYSVALGDVDGDGDLDLLTANLGSNSVSVRLNGGDTSGSNTGTFSGGSNVAVGSNPYSVALGDVDGDGDLDIVTANNISNSVSVRLNGGNNQGTNTGTFSNGSEVSVGSNPYSVALGDVDGDGDLDLLTANDGSGDGTVSVRLNGNTNTGTFSSGSEVAAGSNSRSVALGDADGDGDLDIVTANAGSNSVSVRLNQVPCTAPTAVALGTLTPTTAQVTFTGNGTASGGYTATATPSGGGPAVSATGPASPLTLTGLVPNTAYTVVVSSLCANSQTATSSPPVAFTTPCEKPMLTVPANQTLAADAGQCSATRTFAATATGTPAPSISYAVGSTPITFPYAFPVGQTTVTVTARNSCGDTDTKAFTVQVQDQQAPVARTRNVSVALVNGQASITAAQVDNGSSDNCTIKSITVSPNTFTCANIGANPVTLTVTDASNNVSTATATVTVTGSVPQPSISVSPSKTIYLGYGPQTATLTASGGGSGATYQWSPTAGLSNPGSATTTFTASTAGSFTYKVTVTSSSGCVASTSVTLTVVDARCGNKNDKVLVCHKGNTLCIGAEGVQDHLNHGDQLGACPGKAQTASALVVAPQAEVPELDLTPLLEAYPNPFAASTTVRFRPGQDGAVRVQVYDGLGRLVRTLYEGPAQAGQVVERAFDGAGLSSGLYTVRLTSAGGQPLVQKLLLSH